MRPEVVIVVSMLEGMGVLLAAYIWGNLIYQSIMDRYEKRHSPTSTDYEKLYPKAVRYLKEHPPENMDHDPLLGDRQELVRRRARTYLRNDDRDRDMEV